MIMKYCGWWAEKPLSLQLLVLRIYTDQKFIIMMPINVLVPDGAGWSANILLSSILCGYLWFRTHCQWSGDFIQNGSSDFTALKISTLCMAWYILITPKMFRAKGRPDDYGCNMLPHPIPSMEYSLQTRLIAADALPPCVACSSTATMSVFDYRVLLSSLTHCGLVTPFDDIDLCQHWLR